MNNTITIEDIQTLAPTQPRNLIWDALKVAGQISGRVAKVGRGGHPSRLEITTEDREVVISEVLRSLGIVAHPPTSPTSFKDMTLDEVKAVVANPSTARKDLMRLAKERFGLPGIHVGLSGEAMAAKILAAVEAEDCHNIIRSEASKVIELPPEAVARMEELVADPPPTSNEQSKEAQLLIKQEESDPSLPLGARVPYDEITTRVGQIVKAEKWHPRDPDFIDTGVQEALAQWIAGVPVDVMSALVHMMTSERRAIILFTVLSDLLGIAKYGDPNFVGLGKSSPETVDDGIEITSH